VVVKTIARFHAITLTYKKVMFDVFKTHSAQVNFQYFHFEASFIENLLVLYSRIKDSHMGEGVR
jgi:hypothetical protein